MERVLLITIVTTHNAQNNSLDWRTLFNRTTPIQYHNWLALEIPCAPLQSKTVLIPSQYSILNHNQFIHRLIDCYFRGWRENVHFRALCLHSAFVVNKNRIKKNHFFFDNKINAVFCPFFYISRSINFPVRHHPFNFEPNEKRKKKKLGSRNYVTCDAIEWNKWPSDYGCVRTA